MKAHLSCLGDYFFCHNTRYCIEAERCKGIMESRQVPLSVLQVVGNRRDMQLHNANVQLKSDLAMMRWIAKANEFWFFKKHKGA